MGTPIRGRDSLTVVQAQLAVRSVTPYDVRPVATANYVARMHKHCTEHGLVLRVLLAQFLHETGYAGPSGRWNELNPAGLGITNGADNTPYRIDTGEQAADVHAWSMLVALREWDKAAKIALPPVFDTWKKRWTAKYQNPACPVVNNIEDLNDIYRINGDINATWAVDSDYDAKILRIMPAVFTLGSVQWGTPPETPNMSIPYAAPPLEIAITPYNNANRPKLEMVSPSYITVHEVGNTSPGADETMHKIFVHNGGGSAQVSFHFVVGPSRAIQLIPLDEAAWHASDGYSGTGNRDSVAIETIQIGDFNKTLWNLAWLINEIAVNPGRFYFNRARQWDFSIDHIKQHHDWAPDGKNCPQFIRDRGLWPELMRRVDLWHAAGQPAPAPDPEPEPEPEPEAKHTLPKGMSTQLARRLFGAYVAPWDDTVFAFDLEQAPSQVWVARGKRSIPAGGTWADGNWPELNEVIRRGNGNQVWVWSDGSTYERNLSGG